MYSYDHISKEPALTLSSSVYEWMGCVAIGAYK